MRYFFLIFISACGFAQQTVKVDFKALHAYLELDAATKMVSGKIVYDFEVLAKTDTIRIDAKSMVITNLKINNKTVPFKATPTTLQLFKGYKRGKNTLTFDYQAIPKQTLYFIGENDNLQIWTQGQGKYTSHWLPSFDDVNEKVVFNISVTYDKNFEAISNGVLKNKTENTEKFTWNYEMQKPMSSYLVMLAIGKFSKQMQFSTSGIPLEMYYRPEDQAKFETTYRHSKAIFDFLEKEIGTNYPWKIYKQVPVLDFLYAGMENTSATIFAQDYVVDAIGFNDRNYINVNAHELAHQWFGDLVTAKSGKDHWLQEGFATYYALLAEKELFGENHFNWKMYEMAERLQQAAKTDTIPILNESASALTFYQKGAWALHILREKVGIENFRKAVRNYLKKYSFKNVDTNDFLTEINKISAFDITGFRETWLEKPGFEVNEAIALLKKNGFIKDYFDLLILQETPLEQKAGLLETVLKSDAYYPVKEEVVFQLKEIPFAEKQKLLQLALQTKDINVRQAVANTLKTIPVAFYSEYLGLLEDESYITKEIALNNLWSKFPEKRMELLDKTKSLIGFNDKNLRILWLTMALSTKEYRAEEKLKFYEQLLDYASARYESSVRQNALNSLLYLDPNDTNALQALINPIVHHKWQFSKFARDKIRMFLKKEKYKIFYTDLMSKLPEADRLQLNKLLKE